MMSCNNSCDAIAIAGAVALLGSVWGGEDKSVALLGNFDYF